MSFYLGFLAFFMIVSGSTFVYNVDLGDLQSLWRGYFIFICFEWCLLSFLLIALAHRPFGKTGRLLQKLCHNDIYWVGITSVVLIASTLVSVFVHVWF